MKKPGSIKRILCGVGVVLVLLFGSVLLEQRLQLAARPPESLQTIKDFQLWQAGNIKGQGIYQRGGVTYTVMLAPAGGYLASGPSAYLFDEMGRFVDWTPDMGDYSTVTHCFDLTSGHVKDVAPVGSE